MSTISFPSPLLDEQNMTQQCKDLMSSLPRELGYSSSHFYQYHGFWFLPFHLEGIHACRQHFQAHHTDVFLLTFPKSGATWLKAVAFAVMNRQTHGGSTTNRPLLATNPHDLVPFLENKLYLRGEVPDLTCLASPASVKESSSKLVYLCRNPKDPLVSFWHLPNNMRLKSEEKIPLDEVLDCYSRGVYSYGPFWDLFWVLFLKYEEMKEDPAARVRRLALFLGCPFSQEEENSGLFDEIVKLCGFEHSSNLEVNKKGRWGSGFENRLLFRRGEVGDWKNHLTTEMADRLDTICEGKFRGSGLKF
ncbi:hypothetical protein NMG60_11009398 [Bertholletia excelsa]